MSKWYFYIARCKDKSLYIGMSSNVSKRLERHNSGWGAKWIKQHGSAQIVYREIYSEYKDARNRELQIKKWS